ncbi:glucoamylase [Flagelloscypha sp. PMI_526]|nr:glucoamylase [Flagelloscypha sp. PMI_526]
MHLGFLFFGLVALGVTAQTSVDSYIATESPIAKAGLVANIGPSGSKSSGAKAGIVIASPSTSNPDYLYTWTRDASLVLKLIIDEYVTGRDTTTRTTIDNFVSAQKILQQVSNPSGTAGDTGLGEPKFNIDETAFTGAWGRPQRDGPALRAIALITYSNWLISQGNTTYASGTVWPVVKLDCDYVVKYWNQTGFDLWEEVSSSSYFTTAVQHRALRQCATLATSLGQSATTYTTEAPKVLCFQQSYWNTGGYMTANTGGGRSGKDANTVLTSIHTFDPAAGCDAVTFQPCSDKALANLKVYVDAFRSIYTINSGVASNRGVATGRYPEDSYQGKNACCLFPWYLTTLAAGEQLYDALYVWNQQGSLSVTSTSLAFFQSFSSSVAVGNYSSTSATYTTLTTAIKTYADDFVAFVAKYTPSNGGLAEQYSGSTGTPVSAVDLTWSYAAALTAFNRRASLLGPSWGASGLTVPTTCGGGGGGTVAVTFNVQATTENIYITGSVDALANWSPDNALLLSSANYPTWSITVNLPASTTVEWKYIRKYNGAVTWESDPNRSLNVPASGTYTENDTWR